MNLTFGFGVIHFLHSSLQYERQKTMFGVGITELVIVAFIGLLLFGKRLPEVARSMGLSITEFKKGVRGIEEDTPERGRPYSTRNT